MNHVTNILVIDDNSQDFLFLNTAIEQNIKSKVYLARTGSEVLKQIDDYDIALSIVNADLPSIMGLDVALELSYKLKRNKIPVIYVFEDSFYKNGFFERDENDNIDRINKPINYDELISKIKAKLTIRNKERPGEIAGYSSLTGTLPQSSYTGSYYSLFRNSSVGFYNLSLSGEIILANSTLLKMFGFNSTEESQKCNILNDLFWCDAERKKFSNNLFLHGEVVGFQAKWNENNALEKVLLGNARLVSQDTKPSLFIEGTFQDVTKYADAWQFQLLYRDLSSSLSGANTFDEAAEHIVSRLHLVENFDIVGVYINNMKAGRLELVKHIGASADFAKSTTYYDYHSEHHNMINTGKVMLYAADEMPWTSNNYIRSEEVKNIILIPIKWESMVLGCINIASKRKRNLTLQTVTMLKALQPLFVISFHKIYYNNLKKESKDNMELLLNSVDDFVFVTNMKGQIIAVSKSVERKLGYSIDDIRNVGVEKLHPENRREEAVSIINAMIEGHEKHCNVPLVNTKNELVPVETRVSESIWNGEKCLIGISRDISERVARDKMLAYRSEFEELMIRISLRMLDAAYEKMDKQIQLSISDIGKLMGVDRSYIFLFFNGLSRMVNTHEWCNKGIEPQIDMLQNLDSKEFTWWVKKITNNETIHIKNVDNLPKEATNEKKILKAQGIQSLVVVPLSFKTEIIGFMGFDSVRKRMTFLEDAIKMLKVAASIFTNAIVNRRNSIKIKDYQNNLKKKVKDRTRELYSANEKLKNEIRIRKSTEKELKKSYMAIEQSGVSIYITDINGNIEYVNSQSCLTTGYKEEELIGKNMSIFDSGRQTNEFYQDFWDTILQGKVWRGRLQNKTKSEDIIWEDQIVSPVKNHKEEIINFISIKKDITEQKELENHLIQSEKMKALGKLAGGVAHDINNILQIISVCTDWLDIEGAEKDESIEQIRDAIFRGQKMIRSLLDYTGSRKESKEFFSLDQSCKTFITTLSSLIPRTTRLTFSSNSNYVIYGDRSRLEQVILNLVLNAKDAIVGKGEIKVKLIQASTVLKKKYSLNGYWINLKVQDNGCGMDDTTMGHAIDPFFTTKEVGKGTGLGLSVVFGIIEDHEGIIDVDSVLGKGTTINILLPGIDKIN